MTETKPAAIRNEALIWFTFSSLLLIRSQRSYKNTGIFSSVSPSPSNRCNQKVNYRMGAQEGFLKLHFVVKADLKYFNREQLVP